MGTKSTACIPACHRYFNFSYFLANYLILPPDQEAPVNDAFLTVLLIGVSHLVRHIFTLGIWQGRVSGFRKKGTK